LKESTPFDDIILRIIKERVNRQMSESNKSKYILNFAQYCRVVYLEMHKSSKDKWNSIEETEKSGRVFDINSLKDIMEYESITIKSNLDYFNFIETLNRFGSFFKVLSPEYKEIPNLYRIRIYRNKAIDHWSDYSKYLANPQVGLILNEKNISIPLHTGNRYLPISEKTIDKMNEECKGFESTCDLSMLHKTDNPEAISHIIFSNLEKIEPKLSFKKPEFDILINLLFEYDFPLPIHDIELYVEKLVNWLEGFIRIKVVKVGKEVN